LNKPRNKIDLKKRGDRRCMTSIPLTADRWTRCVYGRFEYGCPAPSNERQASFKHVTPIPSGAEWKMRVENGVGAWVGFATHKYNVANRATTYESTVRVDLTSGLVYIFSDITESGKNYQYSRPLVNHLRKHMPYASYNLSLRCEKGTNIPQIQFNNNNMWHNFAPGECALKAEPLFPYLMLRGTACLSEHQIAVPKPTKSAQKTQ